MEIDEIKLREISRMARTVAERASDDDERALAACLAGLCESISDAPSHKPPHRAVD